MYHNLSRKIPFIFISILTTLFSCNHHENMMEDTKYVFQQEDFVEFSEETKDSLIQPNQLSKEDKIRYHRGDYCFWFKLSPNSPLISSRNKVVQQSILEAISKLASIRKNQKVYNNRNSV